MPDRVAGAAKLRPWNTETHPAYREGDVVYVNLAGYGWTRVHPESGVEFLPKAQPTLAESDRAVVEK